MLPVKESFATWVMSGWLAVVPAFAPVVAAADVPRVVVDLPVVGSLVSQVMGGLGQPQVLLAPGADAHDFQLRPSQAAGIADSDLVIWIGPDMSPWLERALAAVGTGPRSVALLQVPGVTLRPFNGVAGTVDPHAWFDPANAGAWIGAIERAMTGADPAHATAYRANAETARAALSQTDAQVRSILAPVGDAPLIMFHDAFGYFAATYHLNIVATVEPGDAAEPGAKRIAAIRALLAAGKTVCAFPEQNHDPAFLTTLGEGNGLRIGGALDPEAVTQRQGPGLYDALMLSVASAIAACAAP